MRHYEILAAGAVPYFLGLAHCPSRTMAAFPRHLVLQAMALPGLLVRPPPSSLSHSPSSSLPLSVCRLSLPTSTLLPSLPLRPLLSSPLYAPSSPLLPLPLLCTFLSLPLPTVLSIPQSVASLCLPL